ncbi:polysaccharide deacetylase family protein [Candidatus Poriferisodalis sp.]|uniref:polysaccharide deacetylase family protein n=1 Tax=Candidatus Poriferisodalis sp. TaxID=3101277 RepID=UPI003B02AECE
MAPQFLNNQDDFGSGPSRDYVGYGEHPPEFSWPGGASVAMNIVVNYEEGSEYSLPMGDGRNDMLGEVNRPLDPSIRDLAMESMYEYGSRVGVWREMGIFAEAGINCTFFACAVAIERNPEVGRRLIEEGHEICSHGYRWVEHYAMTRDEERESIRLAVESFEKTCGERPVGWYCRYGPSVHTRELVVEEGGFLYDGDSYNDELPYYVDVGGTSHLVVPYALDLNDVRFVMPQGYSSGEDFFSDGKAAVDRLRHEAERSGVARMLSVGTHPRLIGRPARADALARLIDYAQGTGDVWFARRDEIARFWLSEFPSG